MWGNFLSDEAVGKHDDRPLLYFLYIVSQHFVIVNMVCYKKKQRKCAAEMEYNISP